MKGHGSQIANLNLFYWDTYRRRVLQRSINLSLPQEDISATRAPQHPLESGYALAQDHAGDETGQKGMLDGRRGVVMRRWGYCGVWGRNFKLKVELCCFLKRPWCVVKLGRVADGCKKWYQEKIFAKKQQITQTFYGVSQGVDIRVDFSNICLRMM